MVLINTLLMKRPFKMPIFSLLIDTFLCHLTNCQERSRRSRIRFYFNYFLYYIPPGLWRCFNHVIRCKLGSGIYFQCTPGNPNIMDQTTGCCVWSMLCSFSWIERASFYNSLLMLYFLLSVTALEMLWLCAGSYYQSLQMFFW